MKRKLFILTMAAVMGMTSFSVASMAENKVTVFAEDIDDEDIEMEEVDADDDSYEDEDEDIEAVTITADDLTVTPAKKTIKVKKSFTIGVALKDEKEFSDVSDEEIDEMIDDSIDQISFRSTKSSVAYVNKTTGKVIGKKAGSAYIKTTIICADGSSKTFKTKVYVRK